MSWFGDTFGDSLNTLKGQITKITKEVLADEETANNSSEESQLVKELQALCESKDQEIATLRDECKKLQFKSQGEFFKSDNELENQRLSQLENELVQLKEERDHLNSCLDELQSEHQVNLDQVILIRDKYKNELEELKKEYNILKELGNSNSFSEIKKKDDEINVLNSKIEELHLEVGREKKEKEELVKSMQQLANETENSRVFQLQLETERKEKENLQNLLRKQSEEKDAILKSTVEQFQLQVEKERKEKEELMKSFQQQANETENSRVFQLQLETERKEKENLQNLLRKQSEENDAILKSTVEQFQVQVEKERKEKEELISSIKQLTNEKEGLVSSEIQNLQLQLEAERKEKQNLANGVKVQTDEKDELRKQLNKLLGDFQVISSDKQKTEEQSKSIKNENDELRRKLNEKEAEVRESEIKLKILLNEKDELLQKTTGEVQKKLESLLKSDQEGGGNIIDVLNKVEDSFKSLEKTSGNLEKLREENESLKNCLKTSKEMESGWQEEISSLKKALSEKEKSQDCINQSQTDDVKRLEQEISHFMSLMVMKNTEINDYSKSLKNLEQELENLKSASIKIEEELLATKNEKKTLEEEVERLKNKQDLGEKLTAVETQNAELSQMNNRLKNRTEELEKQMAELTAGKDKTKTLQEELEKVALSKTNLEEYCERLRKENEKLKNDFEHLKAQVIVKESGVSELMRANAYFQEEVNKLQAQNNELLNSEKEIKKWKDASVDLEIQRQDLMTSKEELENECLRLRSELELVTAKDMEIQQLKQTNANLIESCNQLHHQLESKAQTEHSRLEQEKQQAQLTTELQEENAELKTRIQKFQEQMKMQILNVTEEGQQQQQQHRRSKSTVDFNSVPEKSNEDGELKQALLQEQNKYRLLHQQFQEISEKEANARKEFERLRQHLIEVEDHYTEEAVENEKTINELKSKLMAAEEQLQNSSTLYTSLKVRDNQHLESLQSQIRMVTVQRDEFQSKLSAAEDEVQKHKASLMSLQIVLEQFQQDKDREVEEVAMKYEKQIQLSHNRFGGLEAEIEGLNKQLAEAKNGLKAASRLGEQLEKKTQQVAELEEKISLSSGKVVELERSLENANQAQNGKIDKSLIKNLVVGYVLSTNAERKSQVLKIMASVLDFDQEERNKMGVDASTSGWLANILHPKGGAPTNQSLSEAFIKFLENESKPQPQLKLHPEQFQSAAPKPSRASPKPPPRISELTLPTFNSLQESESNILKNVLKDS